MRVLLQRVRCASVRIDETRIAGIGAGLLALVGFGRGDDDSELTRMADKIAGLRVFADERGRFQFSILDEGAEVLAVPQFTLYGDTSRGRRPDFTGALDPESASVLFDRFVAALRAAGVGRVATGRFGANMQVELVNDGPVTLMLER